MTQRQPRAAYKGMARMAEYTAKLARKLAEPGNDQECGGKNLVRELKRTVRRQQDQMDVILKYLAQGGAAGIYDMGALKHRAVCVNGQPNSGREMNIQATRDALSDRFMAAYCDEDPDWMGGALCDLGMCETIGEFMVWMEENHLEDAEALFVFDDSNGL